MIRYNALHVLVVKVIPPEFFKHLQVDPPRSIFLRVFQKEWRGKLERNSEGALVIKDGWAKFVALHNLVTGDILVFYLKKGIVSYVKVFGSNSLRKVVKKNKRTSRRNVRIEREREVVVEEQQDLAPVQHVKTEPVEETTTQSEPEPVEETKTQTAGIQWFQLLTNLFHLVTQL